MNLGNSRRLRLAVICSLALLSIIVFRFSDLDLWVSAQFYDANAKHVWSYNQTWWVNVLYASVSYLSYTVLIFCVGVFALAMFKPSIKPYRHIVVLVISVFLISPGLIVNMGFKEHFGRPRPYETTQFNGSAEFQSLFQYNQAGAGKYYSFPSGHSSVPFALIAFWFALHLRHPNFAKAALISSLSLAALIGLARIAAGGHYLSDVLWSGFFAYFVAEGLNYFLKSDQLLDNNSSLLTNRERALTVSAIVFLIILSVWFS